MLLLHPEGWKDYELLDCGDFEKLERFGKFITIRPEPQAVWPRVWNEQEWKKRAHVKFVQRTSSGGDWQKIKEMPDTWRISYSLDETHAITLKLALTGFKHTGVFPEQAVNWKYIFEHIKKMKSPQPRFLNLFAYTGAASLAARAAGADVYHVDSIKQVVNWASDNMKLSSLDNIRWVVEDAVKFVQREVKRGNFYNGIILDPPSFGHGPKGEKWKLEDQIADLMHSVVKLLDEKEHFLILNTYSLGFSSLIVENMLKRVNPALETGELYIPAQTGVNLPLGVFGRFYYSK
ncbi:MAG: class I SAM-dependent methyltransferase [Flavobacteriales bacterium]